jgi:arginase family enzyme
VHLDCDVLTGGLLATEYAVPNGLSYADLREAFEALARHDLLGLEIAEYEECWPDGRLSRPDELVAAIGPVVGRTHISPD